MHDDADRFRMRRLTLTDRHPDRAYVLPAWPVRMRNPTVAHPYKQQGDLLYLSGVREPEAVLVLAPDASGGRTEVLFARPADPIRALWYGDVAGVERLATAAGVEDARPIARFGDDLPALLVHARDVAFRLGIDARHDAALVSALERARHLRRSIPTDVAAEHRRVNEGLPAVTDPRDDVAELRLRKDAGEIDRMRRAGEASAAAHAALMKSARPGESGRALAGRLEASFLEAGADGPAYGTIVAMGAEALCLHASPSDATLASFCLVDAGCDVDGYASDCTRTFPAGRRFEPAAAELYDAVLAAQEAAVAAVKPGATLADVHAAAARRLEDALPALGLDAPLRRWLPHPVSHFIGLDVHDSGSYDAGGRPRPLEPGMAFTVEPGLYVPADAAEAAERMRGLAVRIEDTVLVTADGVEVLTAAAPKRRPDVETLRPGA